MKWEQYAEFMRSRSGSWTVEHYVQGMFEEVGEISSCYRKRLYGMTPDRYKIIEEVGDLLWFATGYFWLREGEDGRRRAPMIEDIVHPDVVSTVVDAGEISALFSMGTIAGRIMNAAGYYITFKEDIVPEMAVDVIELLEFAGILLRAQGWTWEQVMATNKAKLEVRLKGGFDAKEFFRRDLDAEEEALKS